ncbi:MAG: ATP-binding protein [Streptosporangiaceae bacterium]
MAAGPLCLVPDPGWQVQHARSYPGRRDQVRQVRAFLRDVLVGWPRADDAVMAGSELATNCVLHSRSGVPGGVFTVRAAVLGGVHTYVSVRDDGGHWDFRVSQVQPKHGLDVVQALAGPMNWGVTGDAAGRLVWVRLPWPDIVPLADEPAALETTMPAPPADDDELADLEKLAAELAACGLKAHLVTRQGRLPYLAVQLGDRPPGHRGSDTGCLTTPHTGGAGAQQRPELPIP